MPTMQSVSSYSDLELALMVLLGYYGNGAVRKQKLGGRYSAVQTIVEQILKGTVPAGSGELTEARIRAAVTKVFNKAVTDTAEEIVNELK